MPDTRPIEAIPTVYRGVQMRSRAEADMARLLDLLQMPWRYEATSVLLPGGGHYRPDFTLVSPHPTMLPAWIEVRGRDTADSVEQIANVARAVSADLLPCRVFATVTGSSAFGVTCGAFIGASHYAFAAGCDYRWEIGVCELCHRGVVVMPLLKPTDFCYHCCGGTTVRAEVAIIDGYVSLKNPEAWDSRDALRVRDIREGENMLSLISDLPCRHWE
jgi:hypothetical protein